MSEQVLIFDTTLRDGEQSPGISLDPSEKLAIAAQLARLEVDVIEAGFPAASRGDFDAVEAIAREIRAPIIASLCRTQARDIDRAWEATRHADKPRLHVFIATSAIHLAKKLRMTPEQVRAEVAEGVGRAAGYTSDVEFSAEDASRSDVGFLCEIFQVAVDHGAKTLNIPDTVGYAMPAEYAELVAAVRDTVNGEYVISAHCHDDLGLAVANSLAAVSAGARQVECAVNGLGERAGNAALEEVVMALQTRADHLGAFHVNVQTAELAETSRLVSRVVGYPVQFNKAIVGRNAFAHEAGIHQHGMLEDRNTYEIVDASSVGQEAAQMVLGKHSGRHAFAQALDKIGIAISGDALSQAFARFKDLADQKAEFTDTDLEAIVTGELGVRLADRFVIRDLYFHSGSRIRPTAYVEIADGSTTREAHAEGDGMIDAAFMAITKATGISAALLDFKVSSVMSGHDILGDVIVRLGCEGLDVTGRDISTNVVDASARAYVNALNRIVRLTGATSAGAEREKIVNA